jgi:hypothetical protein
MRIISAIWVRAGVAYLDKTPPVKGALEATTSELHVLRNIVCRFVFNWNDISERLAHLSCWGYRLACI